MYNALQLSLSRRSVAGLALNAQYTMARSFGNTSGSNEALTAGNAAQTLSEWDYDLGFNAFDVRHTFNLTALYSPLPMLRAGLLGGPSGPGDF